MYEFNGWIVLSADAYEVDIDADRVGINGLLQLLEDREANKVTSRYTLHSTNGMHTLHLGGLPPRRRPDESETLELVLQYIARVLPGSYGLVYICDDERQDGFSRNAFEVRVVKRGQVEIVDDPWFSPRIPTIEDAEPTSSTPLP